MKKINSLIFALLAFFSAEAHYYETDINSLLGVTIDSEGNRISEDEELGRLIRFAKKTNDRNLMRSAENLQKIKTKRVNTAVNLTKGQNFLFAKSNELDPTTRQELKEGRLTFAESSIYFTKVYKSSVSGILELIKGNEIIGAGYTNLQENGLVPNGLAMAVDFVKLEALMQVGGTYPSGRLVPASDLATLFNAELEIKQDGTVIFTTLVGNMIENRVNSYAYGAGIKLKHPIFIKPGKKLQFSIKFPEGGGITPTTNELIIRVSLLGDGFKYR